MPGAEGARVAPSQGATAPGGIDGPCLMLPLARAPGMPSRRAGGTRGRAAVAGTRHPISAEARMRAAQFDPDAVSATLSRPGCRQPDRAATQSMAST